MFDFEQVNGLASSFCKRFFFGFAMSIIDNFLIQFIMKKHAYQPIAQKGKSNPANIYLFKLNNRNTRKRSVVLC